MIKNRPGLNSGCYGYTFSRWMSIVVKNNVINVDWGKFCWGRRIGFNCIISGSTPKSIVDAGAMDKQIFQSNGRYGSWFLLIGVATGGSFTDDKNDWLSLVESIFLLYETLRLATLQDHSVPALWRQLIPMVNVLKNNIVLVSFLHNLVYNILQFY